jgi:ATP-dependent RNA helicase DHX33
MYEVKTCHVLSAVEDYVEDAAKQVMQIHHKSGMDGDILVFMPG